MVMQLVSGLSPWINYQGKESWALTQTRPWVPGRVPLAGEAFIPCTSLLHSCHIFRTNGTGFVYMINKWQKEAWYPYVVPFGLFIALTWLGSSVLPEHAYMVYIIKTLLVGWLLWSFRKRFAELVLSTKPIDWVAGVGAGVITLFIWVAPEGILPGIGENNGFDPYSFGLGKILTSVVIFFRIAGAAVVVPVMEELFWRSFIMRWLIDADFLKIQLGRFTWFSFLGTSICFGLEHHRIVVGIAAGLIYGGLLLWRRNLFVPILAHGVTNFCLGIYVLQTGRYEFW